MRRDFDLIRGILIDVEEWSQPSPLQTGNLVYDGITQEQICYHAKLLIEDGYIEGRVIPGNRGGCIAAILLGLTMRGHDFLDAARSNEVWNKAKITVESTVQSASLDVLQDVLRAESRSQLGL